MILGIIGAGYLAAIAGIVRGQERLVLNKVAFFVATPALLFGVLMRSNPQVLASPVIVVTTIAAVVVAGLYTIASRLWFRQDTASATLGATTAGYVNSNNLGLPVAIYILGDAAYIAPLILIQVAVYSPIVLAILESATASPKARKTSKASALRTAFISLARASRNPIIIATVLGAACALLALEIPAFVLEPVDMIGAAAIPLILMSFGMSLHGQRPLAPGTARRPVLAASALKVAAMPLIAWALCLAFRLPAHETFVATVISALPTAQNVYNYAATYGRGDIQVRDTVLITTFASLPVIAVVTALLQA